MSHVPPARPPGMQARAPVSREEAKPSGLDSTRQRSIAQLFVSTLACTDTRGRGSMTPSSNIESGIESNRNLRWIWLHQHGSEI
eukprot:1660019-Pyramimonas_sp.AAC.1